MSAQVILDFGKIERNPGVEKEIEVSLFPFLRFMTPLVVVLSVLTRISYIVIIHLQISDQTEQITINNFPYV